MKLVQQGESGEGIGHGQHARQAGDLLLRQAIGVATAIPALVVVQGQLANLLRIGDVDDEMTGDVDVVPDDGERLGAESTKLAKDIIRDADLADIMEEDDQAESALGGEGGLLGSGPPLCWKSCQLDLNAHMSCQSCTAVILAKVKIGSNGW